MPHFHHKNVCDTHDRVVAQCRCPGPKVTKKVPCPGPDRCPGLKEQVVGHHPACMLCSGACCEVLPVPINAAAMTNDDRRHLRMRGLIVGNEAVLNCVCSNLTPEGSCAIYPTRPQVCRDSKVGGEDCLKAIRLRRKVQEPMIRQLLDGSES